jgi:2-oxo-3-hexenedioate decarboxylase/2-keto-4-pentenoate hydratase
MTQATSGTGSRPRRPRGEESRAKILDAARQIVAVRGYDGTSMAEISRRCGLPSSSLYWHFSDKDDLMSHVIWDSFRTWNSIWDLPEDLDILIRLPQIFEDVRLALRDSPEFLRLGLQLALQQRTDDPRARRMYLEHRKDAVARLSELGHTHFAAVPAPTRRTVISFIIAAVDGLFISLELDDDVDIDRQITLLAKAVILLITDALSEADPAPCPDTGRTPVTTPTDDQLHTLAHQLHAARENATEVPPPTESAPGLTTEQAYRVQSVNRDRDLATGHRIVGHKIGLTSLAMQEQLGVDQPDYGYLTDRMLIGDGGSVPRSTFVAPRVEPEIAFRLSTDLDATGGPVTADDVRAATDAVAVALEIVDSRVADWRITLADTIADNASSAAVVLGPWIPLAGAGDLVAASGELLVNGDIVGSGDGAAVLGDPAEAVAWLVNAYGRLGEKVRAGEFVMSGAMCASAWMHAGDETTARISGLGDVSVSFTGDDTPAVPEDVRPAVAAVAAVVSALPEIPVSHAEIVVVRPLTTDAAAGSADSAGTDAEIDAVTAALRTVGARQGKTILLANPAVPPVTPGATVTCLVDAPVDTPVDAAVLRGITTSVTAAVGGRLASAVTAAPVGDQSATCPVGPDAVAVSLTLDLSSTEK